MFQDQGKILDLVPRGALHLPAPQKLHRPLQAVLQGLHGKLPLPQGSHGARGHPLPQDLLLPQGPALVPEGDAQLVGLLEVQHGEGQADSPFPEHQPVLLQGAPPVGNLTLPRLKRVGFLGSPLHPVRASYAVMHGISTVSSSVTSRVPHGSLDVDARLGFRRTRPGNVVPRKILPHPPTMLCPPGADVGESMYPISEGMGFIAPPHPLFFIRPRPKRKKGGPCPPQTPQPISTLSSRV